MEGLTSGRIIHYVSDASSSYPKGHNPAVVIDVYDKDAGYILLRNFTDLLLYSCTYSEKHEVNTWHWIEKA